METPHYRPPLIAEWMLEKLLPEDNWKTPLGDFEEVYNLMAHESGRFAAFRWYMLQIIKLIPGKIANSIWWSGIMVHNYLKTALRHITKHKAYSFLNISGLAIGMTAFILIMMMIMYEFSYENSHENADNIYRLTIEQVLTDRVFQVSNSPFPLGEAAKNTIPEIVERTRYFFARRNSFVYGDQTFSEPRVIIADPEIFDVFTYPLVMGTKETVLKDRFSLVITENRAAKYFGDENPVGKVIRWDDRLAMTVTGVMKDHPENSEFRPDIIAHSDILREFGADQYYTNWLSQNTNNFVLLNEGADPADVEKKINSVFRSHIPDHDERSVKMEQLTRIHLYANDDIKYIYIFSLTAVLIIVISCINFMNLSTARSANRSREVGMRKVVGATRKQLINQFLGETMIFSSISMVFALLFTYILLPPFKNITGQDLSFVTLFSISNLAGLVLIVIFIGFLSGFYPSFTLSAFRIVRVLKGNLSSGSKSAVFRRLLVVFQFSMSIILITCTFIIGNQLDFMRGKDVGFDRDQMLVLPVFSDELRSNPDAFKKELLKNSGISSVATSMVLPHRIGFYNNVTWEGAEDGDKTEINFNRVGYDFINTYDIKIIEGRDFSPDFPSDLVDESAEIAGGILINETAMQRFGWDSAVDKKVIQVFGNNKIVYNVVGVFQDFHFSSLKNEIRPLCFFLSRRVVSNISVKITNNRVSDTVEYVRSTFERMYPGNEFDYYFLDEQFDNMYRFEVRMKTVFGYFSMLAIFISCLGLFGLASFAAEQRTKEIGVRKVMGASFGDIIYLISKEFVMYVLVANIIAWPVVWFLMNTWLNDFAYRISIEAWSFIGAGLLAFLIAGFTVSFQAVKAAMTNPVNSLKYE